MILACDFIWDGWLSKWHGIGMRGNSIFMDLGRMSWYGFHMWHEWGLVTKVDMGFICMMSIPLLFDYDWYVVNT